MLKDLAVYILFILAIFVLHSKYKEEQEARVLAESNLQYVNNELTKLQEAYEFKEREYSRIEEEIDLRDQRIKELMERDSEALDWLMQIIPSSVDDTIPY